MKILVTGSEGFVGKNLLQRLFEIDGYEVIEFNHQHNLDRLSDSVLQVDCVVHLAGVNRPKSENEFLQVNSVFTQALCQILEACNRKIPILFASSTQATLDNSYGKSKLKAENSLHKYAAITGSQIRILRLPNVFGKWSRPNYNSVVATFCHNIANDQRIEIHNPSTLLNLVYIDDVVSEILKFCSQYDDCLDEAGSSPYSLVKPIYKITLGSLASKVKQFHKDRLSSSVGTVGKGFDRALYATYLSYLTPPKFVNSLDVHSDERGTFSELLKTEESGQMSFFTVNPGQVRGGHYHHTKNERFVVLKGTAKFRFQNIVTQERFSVETVGGTPQVVETVPGWSHDIRNLGDSEMIVLLWSNEVFDPEKPDTYKSDISS